MIPYNGINPSHFPPIVETLVAFLFGDCTRSSMLQGKMYFFLIPDCPKPSMVSILHMPLVANALDIQVFEVPSPCTFRFRQILPFHYGYRVLVPPCPNIFETQFLDFVEYAFGNSCHTHSIDQDSFDYTFQQGQYTFD